MSECKVSGFFSVSIPPPSKLKLLSVSEPAPFYFCVCRQQIEELEEQHRESEASRLAEQEVQEQQLCHKRTQLEGIQSELDESRREVEQVGGDTEYIRCIGCVCWL